MDMVIKKQWTIRDIHSFWKTCDNSMFIVNEPFVINDNDGSPLCVAMLRDDNKFFVVSCWNGDVGVTDLCGILGAWDSNVVYFPDGTAGSRCLSADEWAEFVRRPRFILRNWMDVIQENMRPQ